MKQIIPAFALTLAAAIGADAADEVIYELSLNTDTNAVIEVEEGCTTTIEKLSGNRGTITKTGAGTLNIRLLRNSKARFDVQAGKVFFDRQMPSVCDQAFFHVDASRADTLDIEEENGTNFVVRWSDVRGNGMFATNCLAGPAWRTNPEKRRAFISSVTLNGMPVVDFGTMMFQAYTNELGEALGYGATMIWSQACTNAYEVYEMISETPDVATIAIDYPRFYDKVHAVSFLSSSYDRAGNYREKLKNNGGYPNVFYDNSSNYGWMHGRVYLDGSLTNPNTYGVYGKFNMGAGFHLLGFTTREYVKGVEGDGPDEYRARLNSFARDSSNSFGAQRFAEYLVFTNRLTATERSALQAYLKEKWKGTVPDYIVSELNVADGASVAFAPGVSIKVANVSDGSDVSLGNGTMEINPLNNPDAFFHVDASATETLVTDLVNGTNFVNRWNDAIGNGVYATNYLGTGYTYRSDPENRLPFISAETLNGRPVVDFGSLLVPAYTNETGYGLGHGGCLLWNKTLTSGCGEVFTVARDTEDVKSLYGIVGSEGSKYCGQAYVCDPENMYGYRGALANNAYPKMTTSNTYNDGMGNGEVRVDSVRVGTPKNYIPAEGFHVFNIKFAATHRPEPKWFAHCRVKVSGDTSRRTFGGTRIAEYLVFPNVLSNDVRTAIYRALRTKWFAEAADTSVLRNVEVASGASLAFTWRNLAVTNRLAVGGTLRADAVSAAGLALASEAGQVEGALSIDAGATVETGVLDDGSLASLSVRALTVADGGRVVIGNPAAHAIAFGEHPLIVSQTAPSGSFAGWRVDASALNKVTATLVVRPDGLHVRIAPKGMVFTLR